MDNSFPLDVSGALTSIPAVMGATPVLPSANVTPSDNSMPLGINTNLPTTMPIITTNEATEAKSRRYDLLKIAVGLLPDERVADCSRYPILGAEVELVHDPNTRTGAFHNLAVCGSAAVCPVCAARISFDEQQQVQVFLEAVEVAGGTQIMLALTMQHRTHRPGEDDGQQLKQLGGNFNAALLALKSGRSWSLFKARYGLVGDIVAKEVRYGKNGWHYHAHVVLVSERKLNGDEVDEMQVWLKNRWIKQLGKCGQYASYERGAVLTAQTVQDTAGYVTKWGSAAELTMSEHKDGEGLTPFQLLDQVRIGGDGADRAAALFREYAAFIKGKARLRFSRGLLARFGLDKETLAGCALERMEQAQAEAVADAVLLPQEVMTTLQWWEWSRVVDMGARGQLLRYVAGGKTSLMWDFLESIGVYRPGSRAWVRRWLEVFIVTLWSAGSRQQELVAEFERLKPAAIEHGLSELYERARQEAVGYRGV